MISHEINGNLVEGELEGSPDYEAGHGSGPASPSTNLHGVPEHRDVLSQAHESSTANEQAINLAGHLLAEVGLQLSCARPSVPLRAYCSINDYRMDMDGLSLGRDEQATWVCEPFEILGRTRDAEGCGWGLLLRWLDADGRTHTWAMPTALVHADGAAVVQRLADEGLAIAPGSANRNKLINYLAIINPTQRITCVTSTGWHDTPDGSVYVLPDGTLSAGGNAEVVLQSSVTSRAAFESAGTLTGWQQSLAQLVEGHSRLVLAVSTAFAGPLLKIVGAESGGFHLFGSSSRGKTTTLQAAASVWGRGAAPGFVRSWRTTDNGLEGVASMHSDALLVLDELGEADARTAAASAYMLGNGVGKARAGRSGEARPPAMWRLLFLSSGEVSLADKITEDGSGRRAHAGQAVRVIDIPSDAGAGQGVFDVLPEEVTTARLSGQALAEAIKQAAVTHYGSAGPAFVEAILQVGIEQVRATAAGFIEEWRQEMVPPGADGQVGRVAARFALVAASGELATELGILPWSKRAADRAARRVFAEWLNNRGEDSAEIRGGIAQVRRFLEAHGESRFEPVHPASGRTVHNRAGFVKGDGEGRQWLILPGVWHSEVAGGFDSPALMRALIDRGAAEPGELDSSGRRKLQRKERSPIGPARFYVITAGIFAGDSDA